MASRGDVKAVRKVLYSRKRLRKMLTEIRSIDILMNTNPDAALPSDDIRVTAGSGPVWFILETGAVDPGVLEAAERSRRVAALLRDARRELKDVDFDRDDKRELRNALDEHAAALIARADAWSKPQAENAATAAARIHRHDVKAAKSYRKVKEYLDQDAFEGVL